MEPMCSICMDTIKASSSSNGDGNSVSATKCGHVFHDVCLRQWLRQSRTCPNCRKQLRMKRIVKLCLDGAALLSEGCINSSNDPLQLLRRQLSVAKSKLKAAVASKQREEDVNVALLSKARRTQGVAQMYISRYTRLVRENYRLRRELVGSRQEIGDMENVRRDNLVLQELLRTRERQLQIAEELRNRMELAVYRLNSQLELRDSVLQPHAQHLHALLQDELLRDDFALHSLQQMPPTDMPGAQQDRSSSEDATAEATTPRYMHGNFGQRDPPTTDADGAHES